MQLSKYITQLTLVGVLAYCAHAPAQQFNMPSIPGAASAQGRLTVTLTVVPSVGIVLDERGNPRLMVANAAAAGDNVSWLQPAPLNVVKRTVESDPRVPAKKNLNK